MTEDEIKKAVYAFNKKRPVGIDTPFSELKPGHKFQFKEIDRECICTVTHIEEHFVRYERDDWFYRVYKNDPIYYHRIVEFFPK